MSWQESMKTRFCQPAKAIPRMSSYLMASFSSQDQASHSVTCSVCFWGALPQAAALFYENVFSAAPDPQPLFKGQAAWTEVYDVLSSTMIAAAKA